MSDKRLPYLELVPDTPEHKQFLNNAILTRNFAHLAALKNRTSKTIHLVSNWFWYCLMAGNNFEDVVVIYTEDDKLNMSQLFSEDHEDQ